MFRYAFLVTASALADLPEAAAPTVPAALDGARS